MVTVERSEHEPAVRHVSTGELPPSPRVQAVVAGAVDRYRQVDSGELSAVYPKLLEADPTRFGVCLAGVSGHLYEAGDTDVGFPMMSVAKPLTFALVADVVGAATAKQQLGANATGLPFNSLSAVERSRDGTTNPMVNAGAIAAVMLVAGDSLESKWAHLRAGLSRFAGRDLRLDEAVLASALATNHRNRAIAQLLDAYGLVDGRPALATELYTRQCSLEVTARDLAIMGATLADGGMNPVTGEQVVSAATCRAALSVMATAGMYETSGEWLYDVGVPAKSGIGGGLVASAPGKCGLGAFSPLLDDHGNSVRGQLAMTWLSGTLGLDLLSSAAVDTSSGSSRP